MSPFDLIIIGGGPGGYVAAIRASQLGMRVAIVEKEPMMGGTCLRVGCIPSKALLESSELLSEARSRYAGHGIKLGKVELDLPAMMKRKDQIVSGLAKGIDGLLKKNKITRLAGVGKLVAANKVEIQTADAAQTIEAPKIILATGSRPSSLPGVKLDGDRVATSTEALAFAEPPKHLVVVGAGYIGLELGSVWARLGSQVTVVEYLDRILPGMDAEIAEEARKIFEKQGIQFRLGRKVASAEAAGDGAKVACEGEAPIECDRVLVAVGRAPNTAGLGLEELGVKLDPRGRIQVDSHYATSLPGVWAIGDVIPGPMLAHKAEEDGVACAEILAGGKPHVDYNLIPGVCYTHPEIATVGKTEEQLKEQGIPHNKGISPFKANGRAHALGQTEGKVKLLAHKSTDRILGVHIIGPRAGDMIAEAVAAMAFGASSEDLAMTSHAHPTLPEVLKEAALAALGRPIHF